jgi:hypothetical protein
MVAAAPADEDVAGWLICDHAFQRHYPFGMSKAVPGAGVAPICGRATSGADRTLEELAGRAGSIRVVWRPRSPRSTRAPPSARIRSSAAGRSAFNRGSGDPRAHAEPVAGPDREGPFYAIKVLPGSFGTFAGLKADASSRVLTPTAADPGLYVAGSDQANVMGGHYPPAASTSARP